MKGDGKTTRLVETALALLAEMQEDEKVFVTGAHVQWLLDLKNRFKETGLVGVEFLTPTQIKYGALNGKKGVLLIDDMWELKEEDRVYIAEAKKRLALTMRG